MTDNQKIMTLCPPLPHILGIEIGGRGSYEKCLFASVISYLTMLVVWCQIFMSMVIGFVVV